MLVVQDLKVADDRGNEVVHGVSFEVRSGEIFGIAGVAGNGQDELVEAITGLRKTASGEISLDGRSITTATVRDLHEHGVGFVP
ncbi:ATP-binding cassette domain-containing protein, partial [Pseudomonas sp. AH2 (2023)]|uniref:ATP-binding cassette domain-containing protein n=1 Tax=Pseudomonas sp. AH2 (2023) TaxID=3048599 RepID=UPI002B22ED10